MKKCTKCQSEKQTSEFYINNRTKDGFSQRCKKCLRNIALDRYQSNESVRKRELETSRALLKNNRLQISQLKSNLRCSNCNESEECCLDFHHVDPTTKSYEIGDMVSRGYSIKKIKLEIEKCVVLCANCHRKLHAGLIKIKATV